MFVAALVVVIVSAALAVLYVIKSSDNEKERTFAEQTVQSQWKRKSGETNDAEKTEEADTQTPADDINAEEDVSRITDHTEDAEPKEEWEAAMEGSDARPEYLLAGSESRYISESELDGMTPKEVRLARNELYARHGRKFKDQELTDYFSQFDWYTPTINPGDFTEEMLNVYETANRDLIIQYEQAHGYTK